MKAVEMLNVKRLIGFLATGEMPEMTALDESLAEHDKRFHGGKYDPETMSCEKREQHSEIDLVDTKVNANKIADEEYESASIKKKREMFDAAAKKAMPNTKFVDEDGSPKVMYHGTPLSRDQRKNVRTIHYGGLLGDVKTIRHPFNTFRNGDYDGLIFFTPDYTHARDVADERSMSIPDDENGKEQWTDEGHVFSVYINSEKPFVVGDNEETRAVIEKINNIKAYDFYFGGRHDITKEQALRIIKGSDSWMVAEQKEFLDEVKKQDYDSIVAKDKGCEYVALFSPLNIKDADLVTYDDDEREIPLSKRFDMTNPDIRY